MKYVVLIGDGMGDYPLPELDGRTVLEAADTPHMDALSAGGMLGTAQTIPESLEPGSDVANMAIMGYDPEIFHTGRGPLEAGSLGVSLSPDEQAFRLNLVTLEWEGDRIWMRDHSAGHITNDEAAQIVSDLSRALPLTSGQKLYPGVSYRHLLVWAGLKDGLATIPPHDYRDQDVAAYLNDQNPDIEPVMDLIRESWAVLKDHPVNRKRMAAGKRPANSIWPWGQGRPPAMKTYRERWGIGGAVVSAVDLIKGLGVYAGLDPLEVPGATGLTNTNFQGKVEAALKALETDDFVLVHIEAPDEAGHQGDTANKIEAIELFDRRIVGPIWKALQKQGDYRLLVLCDHYTPISLKTHSREPVPFILHPHPNGSGRPYTEKEATQAGVHIPRAHLLADMLLEGSK